MRSKAANPEKFGHTFTDRLVREDERRFLTSVSRSHCYILERKGLYPARRKLHGGRTNYWKLSELLTWLDTQPKVGE